MSHPLIEQLIALMGQSGNPAPAFEQWRQKCARELNRLAEPKRRELIEQLQQVLAENRQLFQQESQHIINELVQTPPSPLKEAQAKHYRSVRDL
ncbi:hypothetical protein [Saccharospirillum mangrovi]|uniref:hypothetical protein n=1 Tax=Saccharospirillum mangrovi TaxID=2161747 RepID=UPI000D3BEFA0|nr:hypothetical protein [Saccharospirillum mangrovi]